MTRRCGGLAEAKDATGTGGNGVASAEARRGEHYLFKGVLSLHFKTEALDSSHFFNIYCCF